MSTKWHFAAPRVQGIAPRQAHADIPQGLWEREMGRDAFFGPATDFYLRQRSMPGLHLPALPVALRPDGSQTALTDGLELGLMSFDPRGVTHGPVPGALPMVHAKSGASMANEFVTLRVGTRDPLQLGKDAGTVAVAGSEMLHARAIELAPDAVDAAARRIETQTVAS